ncbi:MAG: helix-turn-helix transcriptional regulator [Candidatus Competibacteraceae bacterium]|nr:helix-turn-helix transcriptional regulator [Candidatus Competibacteraceae bacterium]HRY15947.1 helix-turn-helix transcriptional regulator [Candidatus Competibacteraceae bacterium]
MDFGNHIRRIRQRRYQVNRRYSIKSVAERIGVDPDDLERIERNRKPPDEEVLQRLANDLGEDMDLLLALVGQIASDIRETIIRRPVLFTELIRGVSDLPDKKLIMLIHEANRDRSGHGFKPVTRIVDQ